MKTKICLLIYFSLLSGAVKAQTLRLIIAADVEDIEFGLTSISDQEHISKMFKTVAVGLDYKFDVTYLEKTTFNGNSIKKTVQNLRPNKKDFVVFYYTGEGYFPRSSNSDFPYLKHNTWKTQPLSLDEIAKTLNSKEGIYGLILADSRDTMMEKEDAPNFRGTGLSEDWIDKLLIQKIFFENCGVIKIASSQKGQKTYTLANGQSSFFTKRFTDLFTEILGRASIETVDNITLAHMIELRIPYTDFDARSSTGLRQKALWEKLDCDVSKKSIKMSFPSYQNTLGLISLQDQIDQLVHNNKQSSPEKLANNLRKGFTAKATIRVERYHQPGEPAFENITLNIEDYLSQLLKTNSKLITAQVKSEKVMRTKDYSKITELTIQELWE